MKTDARRRGRAFYDKQHPQEAAARAEKEKANKGATEKGQTDLVNAIADLKREIGKRFAK